MEYLQYQILQSFRLQYYSFKPYYKWNTFNTKNWLLVMLINVNVLNLIINGIPSIHCKHYIYT